MNDEQDDAQLPPEQATVQYVEVDRERVLTLVRRIASAIGSEVPGAEVQAAALMIVWATMHADLVREADMPRQQEIVLERTWAFVERAMKWAALSESAAGETVQ